jgi:hypothetical protein
MQSNEDWTLLSILSVLCWKISGHTVFSTLVAGVISSACRWVRDNCLGNTGHQEVKSTHARVDRVSQKGGQGLCARNNAVLRRTCTIDTFLLRCRVPSKFSGRFVPIRYHVTTCRTNQTVEELHPIRSSVRYGSDRTTKQNETRSAPCRFGFARVSRQSVFGFSIRSINRSIAK